MDKADVSAVVSGVSLQPGVLSSIVLMKTIAVTYPSMSTRKRWLPLAIGFPPPLLICYIRRTTKAAKIE